MACLMFLVDTVEYLHIADIVTGGPQKSENANSFLMGVSHFHYHLNYLSEMLTLRCRHIKSLFYFIICFYFLPFCPLYIYCPKKHVSPFLF